MWLVDVVVAVQLESPLSARPTSPTSSTTTQPQFGHRMASTDRCATLRTGGSNDSVSSTFMLLQMFLDVASPGSIRQAWLAFAEQPQPFTNPEFINDVERIAQSIDELDNDRSAFAMIRKRALLIRLVHKWHQERVCRSGATEQCTSRDPKLERGPLKWKLQHRYRWYIFDQYFPGSFVVTPDRITKP